MYAEEGIEILIIHNRQGVQWVQSSFKYELVQLGEMCVSEKGCMYRWFFKRNYINFTLVLLTEPYTELINNWCQNFIETILKYYLWESYWFKATVKLWAHGTVT